MPTSFICPCNSQLNYEACCGIYHNKPGSALTAEALMRSRYTAFYLKKFDYIERTQRLTDDPKQKAADIKDINDTTQWIKLEILATKKGLEKDRTGTVSFAAHFKEGQHIGKLNEHSLFERINEEWFYISGEHDVKGGVPLVKNEEMNIGRNDPCHCGSGKKLKKCCAD